MDNMVTNAYSKSNYDWLRINKAPCFRKNMITTRSERNHRTTFVAIGGPFRRLQNTQRYSTREFKWSKTKTCVNNNFCCRFQIDRLFKLVFYHVCYYPQASWKRYSTERERERERERGRETNRMFLDEIEPVYNWIRQKSKKHFDALRFVNGTWFRMHHFLFALTLSCQASRFVTWEYKLTATYWWRRLSRTAFRRIRRIRRSVVSQSVLLSRLSSSR